ncbi:QueT transporter family protein [Ruminococcaceae bacterium OttesenSCG-928-D13]|nr:QueT transporter family protein [Ruminococcaceae bacterium OttesenSCG-928-D13]
MPVRHISARQLVRAALIAALYAALCLALAPLSYGPVQVRLAEALTLLPVLCAEAVPGVAIGCFFANLLGGAPIDMLVGTGATLAAALLSRRLREVRWPRSTRGGHKGLPIAAALPPVLLNALIVGAELTLLYFPAGSPAAVWLANMASVGAGQLISCGLGVALVWLVERQPTLHRLLTEN